MVFVVGGDTVDMGPSVCIVLETNNGARRYLFNCGEGTQRFCVEHSLRLAKMDVFLFTRLHWEQLGGLPGSILTLADARITNMTLVGPTNTTAFLESTRYFISRNDMLFKVHEYGEHNDASQEGKFEDKANNAVIYPIVLKGLLRNFKNPQDSNATSVSSIVDSKDNVYTVKLAHQIKKRKISDVENMPSKVSHSSKTMASKRNVPVENRSDDCCCYAFHGPPIAGKFDATKANELGIKGADRGKLAKGESVKAPNGTIIHPSDVISPAQPGPIILIIHCPTFQHLEGLIENKTFLKYQKKGTYASLLKIVYHFTPNPILYTDKYSHWTHLFEDSVEHVIINKEVTSKPILFKSWAENHLKLSSIDSEIFPFPYFSDTPSQVDFTKLPNKTRIGEILSSFTLCPNTGWDMSSCFKPTDIKAITANLPKEVAEAFAQFKTEREKFKLEIHKHYDDTNFVFLGTVAAIPSKYRNVTANLITVPEYGNILLDCGEGTLGQIYRLYGNDFETILKNVKLVFISHIHADHHLGLVRVLSYRTELGCPPVTVIGPTVLSYWLKEYLEIQNLNYVFYNCNDFLRCSQLEDSSPHTFQSLLGLRQLQTIAVIHCPDAFGVVIEHQNGWKFVYSGDTRPCPDLIEAGQNADLVVHEATFEGNLENEAIEKFHATTEEAIQVHQKMNSKFLIMNHFSSRYPKVPQFNTDKAKEIGLAFDLMRVNFKSMAHLPLLLPVLRAIYSEDNEPNAEDEENVSITPRNNYGSGGGKKQRTSSVRK
uniref:ribonuclease Z n=1 Tax=Arcella intermedia TaxID=1963864 RepID=A0A6B2KYN5_9EUKA